MIRPQAKTCSAQYIAYAIGAFGSRVVYEVEKFDICDEQIMNHCDPALQCCNYGIFFNFYYVAAANIQKNYFFIIQPG